MSLPAIYAHRGASHDFPEQTLGAFLRALEIGADGLECDVHLSSDGHLICLHDSTVDRTSNGRGRPENYTLAELRGLDWGSWRRFAPPAGSKVSASDGHRLVSLRELLSLAADFGRPVGVAIEAKHPTPARDKLEAAIVQELAYFGLLRPPGDRVGGTRAPGNELHARVISFSKSALRRVSEKAPKVPLAMLDGQGSTATRTGLTPAGVEILSPSIAVLRRHSDLVAKAHSYGREVQIWTVDELEDLELCRRLGVDAITTNRPARALAALRR